MLSIKHIVKLFLTLVFFFDEEIRLIVIFYIYFHSLVQVLLVLMSSGTLQMVEIVNMKFFRKQVLINSNDRIRIII